jgi:hypothetical protein
MSRRLLRNLRSLAQDLLFSPLPTSPPLPLPPSGSLELSRYSSNRIRCGTLLISPVSSKSQSCHQRIRLFSLVSDQYSHRLRLHPLLLLVITESSAGKHVVIFTSRKLHSSSSSQDISFHKQISDSLTAIVSHLSVKPSFLIAKGGITSNDVASIGLNISSAFVLGQIDVGVPVWRTGQESRFPGDISPLASLAPSFSHRALTVGMNYIVFPGNVGSNESLSQVAEKLGVPKKQNNQAAAELFKASEISHLRSVNQTFQLLHAAKTMRSKATAVAAFNVYNLEGAKAVVDAAQELQSPVILQVSLPLD